MQAIYFWPTVALVSVLSSVPVYAANPCVEQYPAAAGEVLTSPGGRVARIEPVAWFEDGVYRITLETGGGYHDSPAGTADAFSRRRTGVTGVLERPASDSLCRMLLSAGYGGLCGGIYLPLS